MLLLFIAFVLAASGNQWIIAACIAIYYVTEVHSCHDCCCEDEED